VTQRISFKGLSPRGAFVGRRSRLCSLRKGIPPRKFENGEKWGENPKAPKMVGPLEAPETFNKGGDSSFIPGGG